MQSLLALKRESKFSNRLTYDLPITEEQCKEEHNAVKDLIRTHNKWLMRHQIKHKIREVQDQLQKIKICHANRRRQRIHRNNKRQRRNSSFAAGEDPHDFYEFELADKIDELTNEGNRKEELHIQSTDVPADSQKSQCQMLDGAEQRLERLRRLSGYLKALLMMPEEGEQKQTPVKSPGQAEIFESID